MISSMSKGDEVNRELSELKRACCSIRREGGGEREREREREREELKEKEKRRKEFKKNY